MNYKIIYITIIAACMSCTPKADMTEASSNVETGNITLSEKQIATIGLHLGKIDSTTITQKIQVNGYVDVPPQGRASVTTFKAGYVKKVSLLIGDKVKKGQQLAVLEHPDYVKIQQDYLDLSGQLSYLKAEYDRQKTLFEDKITAEKNLLKAEAQFKSSDAQFKGLEQELRMLGLSPEQILQGIISRVIEITSPIEGSVTQMNCVVGKYMPASAEMFEIVDPDHLHMELSVYEQDVMKVKVGQRIIADIPNIGMTSIEGHVFLVGQALEDDSRSVRVHAHFEDESIDVLPGMYLEAHITTHAVRVLSLPIGAVITEGENNFIFVKDKETGSESSFIKTSVKIGARDEAHVEILGPGDLMNAQIVVEGASNLSSYNVSSGQNN